MPGLLVSIGYAGLKQPTTTKIDSKSPLIDHPSSPHHTLMYRWFVPSSFCKHGLRAASRRQPRRSFSLLGTEHPEPITLDTTIHMKNAALGLALAGGAVGIGVYSTMRVGQAGSSGDENNALAQLYEEAAAAQEQQTKEASQAEHAKDLMQQLQSGALDPDREEQEALEAELEAAAARRKKPWWKFW